MDSSAIFAIAAMAKWPNVPDCYGWLSLDRRGRWLLQGTPVAHAGLAEFIGRNYARSDCGAWYMQNGPQRVWVRLEAAPWILHLQKSRESGVDGLASHTGQPHAEVRSAWLVDGEALCLETEIGLGWIDDRDLPAFAARLQFADGQPYAGEAAPAGLLQLAWNKLLIPVQHCRQRELPGIGRFNPCPAPKPVAKP